MVEEVEGRRPVGRPRKTWRCIEQDVNQLELREVAAQDRREWRRVINRPTTIIRKGGRKMKKKIQSKGTDKIYITSSKELPLFDC